MSFLKKFLKKENLKTPVFIKDFSDENNLLHSLEKLKSSIKTKSKIDLIKNDINTVKYNLLGEKNLYFEIKNSYVPMLCLHDIRIEFDGKSAQIDFILLTKQFILVIDTKKLSGNITVNENGEFIKKIENRYGKVLRKETLNNPISQNNRHAKLLEDYLTQNKVYKKSIPVKHLLVVASPKSKVDISKAPTKLKSRLIKFDQLTLHLSRELQKYENEKNINEDILYKISNFLTQNNKTKKYDLKARYELKTEDYKTKEDIIQSKISIEEKAINIYLKNELKKYRYTKALEEKINPSYILTNKAIDELVETKPHSLDLLLNINGIGEVKASKYGEDIINILSQNI